MRFSPAVDIDHQLGSDTARDGTGASEIGLSGQRPEQERTFVGEAEKTEGEERPPFDLDRLGPEKRELWDENYSEPPGPESDVGPDFRIMEFGWICAFELVGVRRLVSEYLSETGLPGRVAEYRRNVMEASRYGLIRPEPEADPD